MNKTPNAASIAVYRRLLTYVKPYWKVVVIGVAAGVLVGGSLFVTLLMIPQLAGAVDSQNVVNVKKSPTGEHYVDVSDPKLHSMLQQASAAIERFHLPARIEGRKVTLTWPAEYSFELVSPNGHIAWQLVTLYAAVFILMWAVKNAAHYINGFCMRYVGAKVVADLRNEIFRHLNKQSLSFFSTSDTGALISRCTNDTSVLEYSVSQSIEDLTNAPLQLLGCLGAIIIACRQYDNYALVAILLVGFFIIVLPIHLMGRKIRKIYKKSYSYIADVFSRMHEVFSGITAVKAFNTEKQENLRFQQINRSYTKQIIRGMRLHLLVSPTMELVSVSGAVVFMVYSYGKGVSMTELAALLSPLFMAYRPIKDLGKVFAAVQRSLAGADRFFTLLDTHTELPEKTDAVHMPDFKEKIRVENVSFAYNEEKKILSDVSFEIPKGSVVAVVGETGSGKSTLANLIARFYDVTSGRVTIDGVDVRDIRIADLRKMIGIVSQNPVIFNESIRYNIAYGSPDASDEDIENAAKLANAYEFIVNGNHPAGYDSPAGENGCQLSGGEKQRLVIARAILRNPPILILDEATSALDTVTERMVQEALNRVMANRTVFAIAHRLSTIRHADLILVIKNGVVAEAGNHDDLMAADGIYRRLHDTQFSK